MREGVAAVVAKKERIMGRLSLIKQNHVLFLAWLPYSPGCMLPDGTFHAPAVVATTAAAKGEHFSHAHEDPRTGTSLHSMGH